MATAKKPQPVPLEQDATIASVAGGLGTPEEYVRNVFLGMSKHRDWRVRIAVAGGGEAPDYLYDSPANDENGPEAPAVTGAFSGGTHRALLQQRASTNSWSTASMSWTEVQALLGGFRGRKVR